MIEVSVIVPCFNAALTIERTAASILFQNISVEIIIIDDCSVDNSLEVIKTLANSHPEIRTFRTRSNSGPAYCRNLGLESARGEYIAFLDADDFWLPNKLVLQIAFMKLNNFLFSFHDYYEAIIFDAHICEAKLILAPELAELPTYFYKRGFGMCLTSVVKRTAVGPIRFPNDRSISSEDYGFFLKLLSSGVKGYRLPQALGVYSSAKSSRSSNKIRQAISVLKCNIRESKKSRFVAIYYFGVYVLHQLLSRFDFGRRNCNNAIDTGLPQKILYLIKNSSLQQYFQTGKSKP